MEQLLRTKNRFAKKKETSLLLENKFATVTYVGWYPYRKTFRKRFRNTVSAKLLIHFKQLIRIISLSSY